MPSEQDCAERLREQAYRTLLPQIKDLEQELERLGSSLATGIRQVGRKLEALSRIELPTTEVVLREFLEDVVQQKDLEASSLLLFAHGIRQKETQEEILGFLLDGAHKHFSRVSLFALRGDRLVGWSSRGYSDALAQNISSCSFILSECPQLQAAFEGENPTAVRDFSGDQNPLHFLQAESQGSWYLLPLFVMQRPVALLLAEKTENAPGSSNAIEVLADIAMLRLENIALKILYELTISRPEPVSPAVHAGTAAGPKPSTVAEPSPATQSSFETGIPSPELKAVEEAVLATHLESMEKQGFPMEGAEAPVAATLQSSAAEASLKEVGQTPNEEKAHADAKRFARLLVSEIKLYNEHHVLEGRRNGDLYLRLKRDIDKSREMYEKRVSPAVSQKIDYFHDEIIRILGDNDPSTLGSDYPGPRVEG